MHEQIKNADLVVSFLFTDTLVKGQIKKAEKVAIEGMVPSEKKAGSALL